ncbi:DUF2865 domain-containing protein [Methyloligella halotolerans]|uniref:DUF2865 domain-containing protein n=1 Tax=Methyloligella halotolerans TaxID=1177755 RepID=UPI00147193B5|nr:DUF2865 domain-containing protein [Methyloligella halotolerans]
MSISRFFHRGLAAGRKVVSDLGAPRAALLVFAGASLAGAGVVAVAQPMNDHELRCMQLQQELQSARSGGAGRGELPRLDQEIAGLQRVYRGTESAMENSGCFESFFIFGRGVVRSPRCLSMNDRLEDSRRRLKQLQDRRQAVSSGRGDQRLVRDLEDALARNGCGGQQASRRGGGLFDWFGGRDRDEYGGPPVSRQILSNVPYRTVCVRLCDGFYYPISYSVYSSNFNHDASQCQQNCAAPAELYVYQNPGQEMEQAISLNGQPYIDLPIAFKYRKEYIKGCSCKQTEYNPTEIESANQKAEGGQPGDDGTTTMASPADDASGDGAPPDAQPFDDANAPPAENLNFDFDDGMGGNAMEPGAPSADDGQNAGGEDLSPGAAEADAILNDGGDWQPAGPQELQPQNGAPQQIQPQMQPQGQPQGQSSTINKTPY